MILLKDKELRSLTLDNLYKKYRGLFLNIFNFGGMDYGVKTYFMTKLLEEGQIAAFNLNTPKSAEYTELAFATFTEKSWKWDDTPLTVSVMNARNAPYWKDGVLKVNKDVVILKLDYIPNRLIREYSQRIYDIQATIDTNINLHKMPFVIKSTDNKTVRAIKDILNNEKIIAVNDLHFDIVEAKAPYIIDKLQEYKSEVESELLTMLGIDNIKYEKKAQMTADEIDKNYEEISSYRRMLKDKIEAFFSQINEVLGHDLYIEEEEPEIIEEEEDEEDDV